MKPQKILTAALLACFFQTASAADIKTVDGVAAVAGDSVITMRQFEQAVAQARRLPAAQRPPENELRQQVLAQLINQSPQAEVDEAVAHAAAEQKISVDQLYARAAKDGLSKAALRRQTADALVAQKVQQQAILQNARVSEAEVDAALARAQQQGVAIPEGEAPRQYRAQHILIKAEKENAVAAAETVINKIRAQAEKGRDFGELARQYSQDGNAAQGGDLGWFGDGMMVPEFESAVQKLKKGQVSRPVRTQFGWHLIKLNDVREVGTPEERRRNTIRQYIMQQKAEQAAGQLLQQLHESTYVDVRIK